MIFPLPTFAPRIPEIPNPLANLNRALQAQQTAQIEGVSRMVQRLQESHRIGLQNRLDALAESMAPVDTAAAAHRIVAALMAPQEGEGDE